MPDNPQTDYLSFDEFPIPTYDEWQAAAVASLEGKPFDKLTTPTYEGIALRPLYRRDDTAGLTFAGTLPGRPPYVRGRAAAGYLARPWRVAQETTGGDPAAVNGDLLADLARGQTAVNLVLDAAGRAGHDPDTAAPDAVGHGGVSLATTDDLATALDGVRLSAVTLTVRCGPSALPLLALLVAYLRRAGQPVASLEGCLAADPLAALAETGAVDLTAAYDDMAAVTAWAAHEAPELATVAVDSAVYHEAGASAVEELACALASGVAYLRALGERGVDVATAASRLSFDFAIGGHFFMEIAKLRAARLLWSQVVAAFGGDEAAQALHLHARTARRNKAAIDPHVNMLRVTTEALAAAVGGVDSLHVGPFDESFGPTDYFSRRIARNVQLILQEEAHLTQVIDPAGGSYAVEALTGELAHEAWALFQEIERRGGMAQALHDGFIHQAIAAVADKRAAALAKRRDVLVGVNQYANPAETFRPPATPVNDALAQTRAEYLAAHRNRRDPAAVAAELDRLAQAAPGERIAAAIAAAEAGATLGEIATPDLIGFGNLSGQVETSAPPDSPATVLHPQRAAEPFEALRAQAADYARIHGHPPRVYLANLGPPRQHKARAEFAQAFFEVGGFQVITNNGFLTPEQAAAAALASGAPAVVICSSDDTYPALVPPLVAALRAQSPGVTIILAGRPAAQVEAMQAAGVDEFIYLGADVVALNAWLHRIHVHSTPAQHLHQPNLPIS